MATAAINVYTFIYSKIIVFRFQIYENLTTKQIIFKKKAVIRSKALTSLWINT